MSVCSPHSDSPWPHTSEVASKWLDPPPEDIQHKITIGSASRVYNFMTADPAAVAP